MAHSVHPTPKKFSCYRSPTVTSKSDISRSMDTVIICELSSYEVHMVERAISAYMQDIKGFEFSSGPMCVLIDVLRKLKG